MILDDAVVFYVAAGIRAGIGEEPSSFAFPGTTDATYLVPAGVPCVICGPGNLARAHRENERVPVAEVVVATCAYALAAGEYSATAAP